MRTEIVSNLAVSHFVTLPSRGGTAHSVVSISIDGVRIPELPIVGGVQPNSGKNVIAAFRGISKSAIVGWLDPVTRTPVVVIPQMVMYNPILVFTLFPLLLLLLLVASSYRDFLIFLTIALATFLTLIQGIGWPGVARHLKKAQAQSEEKHL